MSKRPDDTYHHLLKRAAYLKIAARGAMENVEHFTRVGNFDRARIEREKARWWYTDARKTKKEARAVRREGG